MVVEESRFRWIVLASVVASRLVYAISWFDISPASLAISQEFSVDLPSLGILASAFTVGVGLFQIPAGGLAARWGAKKTALLGLLVMAGAGVLSGAAPNFLLLIVSRFVVGLGAAFFFAPAIGIITPLFDPEEKGFAIGLYNGAFGIGAGIGLFGWAILDEFLGWRIGLAIAGIVTAAMAVENYLIIRDANPPKKDAGGSVRAVIRSRSVWFWALGLLGFWGALYVISYFLQHFAETQLSLGKAEAGLLAASISFVAVLGGPVGGRLSDHFRSRKLFMIIPGIIFSLGVMTVGLLALPVLWIIPAALGFIDGFIFAALYAGPSQLPEVGPRYAPLAIGLINSVQILGSFWIPIAFTSLAQSSGYTIAWVFVGAAALAFLPLVALTKEPFSYETPAMKSSSDSTKESLSPHFNRV